MIVDDVVVEMTVGMITITNTLMVAMMIVDGLATPLNFPTYASKSDPLPWLNKCDTFYDHHTLEQEKVRKASLHLDGMEVKWYYKME
jgi:hypothetical protein